ncbi:MAG: ABC transporter ATP-binding protein [Oligoflexia bacterium]|nr:ABC transporter ATP-binding protein [Oligoflexia bacterium]
MHNIIKIENFNFIRSNNKFFNLKINHLEINKNEKWALLGHNGSGKTTLLNSLFGFENYQGLINIFGVDPRKHLKKILPFTSYVAQNPDDGLFCSTIKEDILFACKNFNLLNEKTTETTIINQLLQKIPKLELLLDRPPYELSFGEKKIALLATALAINPSLLIMDEPFSMLDQKQKNNLIEIIQKFEGTLIMATHDPVAIKEICTHSLILSNGLVAYQGNLDETKHTI